MRIRVDGVDVQKRFANERILIDTNIWIYAHNKASEHYSPASSIVLSAMFGFVNAFISYQNILEFYAAITNPKNVEPVPPLSDVEEICNDLWESRTVKKIFPKQKTAIEAIRLSRALNISRTQVYDCFLALTARDNGIGKIWTDNANDFEHFDFITAENPLKFEWSLQKSESSNFEE